MRRALLLALVVGMNAVAQTIIVALDQPALSWVFALVSGILLIVAVWLAWWIAAPDRGLTVRRLAWVAGLGVVTAAAAVVFPYAVPLVVAAGCALLAGREYHRVRSTLVGLLTIVVVALLWAGSAVSGLLIGGLVNAALVWLVVGAAGALLVCLWTAVSARPR